jgi:hypothetical protein
MKTIKDYQFYQTIDWLNRCKFNVYPPNLSNHFQFQLQVNMTKIYARMAILPVRNVPKDYQVVLDYQMEIILYQHTSGQADISHVTKTELFFQYTNVLNRKFTIQSRKYAQKTLNQVRIILTHINSRQNHLWLFSNCFALNTLCYLKSSEEIINHQTLPYINHNLKVWNL